MAEFTFSAPYVRFYCNSVPHFYFSNICTYFHNISCNFMP